MPSVSFDSKSFLLQAGRAGAARLAIAGASFDATLIDPELWGEILGGLRHAGFNTVVIRAPWLLHEPTAGRLVFTGACDLRRAIELAGAAGLKVMVRIGPCVGGGFARGGLPGWVAGRAREANPEFLAAVTAFWRALAGQFVDLQATRNGSSVQRPVIAVGIEDDWRCLDDEVGAAYFSALVRFAREVGIEVPLFTANNCWYSHEGVIDAWSTARSGAGDIVRTADELRQVHPEAAPFMLHDSDEAARAAVESVAARADFVCEVLGGAHRGATSARGCAERAARDIFAMRRTLVFASTFGEILAGMTPDAPRADADGRTVVALRGNGQERIEVVLGAGNAKSRKATAPAEVEFRASGLAIGGSRLEECSGSLVALLDDIVVVAGAPRAKIAVKVDGSRVSVAVPADGAAPKVTKVRGLRIAAVPVALAVGAGIGNGTIEFVDEAGTLLAHIARDGTASRAKAANARKEPPRRPLALSAPRVLAEIALLDGTHARFARIARPDSLGAFGIQSMHGYYGARFAAPKQKGREAWADGAGLSRVTRAALKPRGTAQVIEVRGDSLASVGSHVGERVGVVGPLREVAPLKGVKGALVDLPRFDATRLGRFVWGYEARADAEHRKTVRWTFAARKSPVVAVLPAWWFEEGHASAGHALRLNSALVDGAAPIARSSTVLDGSLLSPMRPKKLAKGEKPPKAKAVKLEPGANELLLDLDPVHAVDDRTLKRLMKDTEFLDVCGEIAADWSFARVSPPASWAASSPLPKKPLGAPAWFRTGFTVDAPRALELSCEHAVGSVATLLVNGEPMMVLDGSSGTRAGAGKKQVLRRVARIPASLVRAGENEIAVFEPDGVMPAIAVR